LHEPLGHRAFVDKTPYFRLVFSIVDEISDLVQVARIAGMDRTKEKPCLEVFVLGPRLEPDTRGTTKSKSSTIFSSSSSAAFETASSGICARWISASGQRSRIHELI
jgi:hypothetical protein